MKYFPDLCKAIKARGSDYRKSKLSRLKLRLNEALAENPPPSFKELASRLEYSGSYISRRFPKQVKDIKRRHREFKRNCSAERKGKAKARIKQIALDFHANGKYPASREILKVCNGGIGMTTAEFIVVLREVRFELGLKSSP